jgi:hypothetical protein
MNPFGGLNSISMFAYKSMASFVSRIFIGVPIRTPPAPQTASELAQEEAPAVGSATEQRRSQPSEEHFEAHAAPVSQMFPPAPLVPATAITTTPPTLQRDVSRRKPNICLIGTSNGVFEDGYVRVFRTSKDIGNFSKNCLGFSSSALFSVMARRVDFTAFDICVLDFAPNDGAMNAAGTALASVIKSTMSDAVRTILQAGCLPAILILPVRSILQSSKNDVRRIYLEIAEEYAIPVFDGYRYLENRRLQGVDVRSLFKDDMHLSRDVAAHVVALFLEGLLIADRLRLPGKKITGSGFTYSYISIGETDLETVSIVNRGTSLIMTDVAYAAGIPEFLIRNLPDDAEVAALAIDFANSYGTLTVSSGTSDKASSSDMIVTNPYSGDDPERFIFGVYPLRPPVKISDKTAAFAPNGDTRGAGRIALGGLVIRQSAYYELTAQLESSLVVSDSIVKGGLVPQLRDGRRWNRQGFLYDRLEQFLLRKNTPNGIYTIKILGVFFDILVENRNSATTVVTFHAEILDRTVSKLPVFDDQVAPPSGTNVILISDPSLHCDPTMPTAWFAGRQGCPVQDSLLLILRDLNEALGNTRLIFTGATSGGFAALYFSYHFPLSLCVAWDPDVRIAESERTFAAAYAKACFEVDDLAKFESLLPAWVTSDLTRLYASGGLNHIVYGLSRNSVAGQDRASYFKAALPPDYADRIVFADVSENDNGAMLQQTMRRHLLADAVLWRGNWAEFVAQINLSARRPETRLEDKRFVPSPPEVDANAEGSFGRVR